MSHILSRFIIFGKIATDFIIFPLKFVYSFQIIIVIIIDIFKVA